ncbi:MAG: P1 family peptidase [Saprospiraceae bacterium]|nr:P1 family peptidase [Saprospiraceae bacterium]
MRCILYLTVLNVLVMNTQISAQTNRNNIRTEGVIMGVMTPGPNNAITDVAGVRVGHLTRIEEPDVCTGVTAILPHDKNPFQNKVPAAIFIGNGFGKLTAISQIQELGNLETPILLTNTLSVPTAADALIDYSVENNPGLRSVNPVVGETNDGYLNDIAGRKLTKADCLAAIAQADTGMVTQGCVGAGTGTICFGWKGGIGTASRKLPTALGGYTVGVLVQTNFGGNLQIAGVPVGEVLGKYAYKDLLENGDGSCMIVVATDAPLLSRNLKRLAKRAFMGLAKTGGIASNGSGDYVIAFSNYSGNLIQINSGDSPHLETFTELANDDLSPLFMAAIEATEEAIINALWQATSTTSNGRTIEALPKEQVLDILRQYHRIR